MTDCNCIVAHASSEGSRSDALDLVRTGDPALVALGLVMLSPCPGA